MQQKMLEQFASECLMGRVRMLNRVVTGMFDHELRPFGVKANQLNLLVVIAKLGPIRRADIGRHIHADPSTLTRNLRVMAANGWIEDVIVDEDERGLPVRATAQGLSLLEALEPAWSKAQAAARRLLGEDGVAAMSRVSASLLGSGPV